MSIRRRSRVQVGSQLTAVDNKSALTAVGVVDLQEYAAENFSLEAKIIYGGDPGTPKSLTLYWIESSEALSIADAIATIGGSAGDGTGWTSDATTLTNGASATDTEYHITARFTPKGRFLYVAYTISDITTALTSVDVYLNLID